MYIHVIFSCVPSYCPPPAVPHVGPTGLHHFGSPRDARRAERLLQHFQPLLVVGLQRRALGAQLRPPARPRPCVSAVASCLCSGISSQFARVVGVASAGFQRSRVRARERIRPPCELLSFSRDTAQRTRSGCCTGWLSPEDCQAGDLLWLRWDAAAFFVALPGNTSAAVMMRSSYRPSENAGEFPAPLPSSAVRHCTGFFV